MTKRTLFRRWLALLLLVGGPCAIAQPTSREMELRTAACINCHGRDGQAGNSDYFPRLAGKSAGYLFDQLRSFRDGRRQQADMSYLLANLSDAYLREMAEYFAGREFPYPPAQPSSLPAAQLGRGKTLVFNGDEARGIPACTQCHGEALTGVAPGVPGLLGLPRLYVASQLGAWVTGERHALPPDCMAEVGRKLSADDIRVVAGWLAAQPMPKSAKPASSLPRDVAVKCSAMEPRR